MAKKKSDDFAFWLAVIVILIGIAMAYGKSRDNEIEPCTPAHNCTPVPNNEDPDVHPLPSEK